MVAGINSRFVTRIGARVHITVGAVLAPLGMFWLSRVHESGHYLTSGALPLLVFAATAGMIFVPFTMTLVAGISDEHAEVASGMFNAGQQVGGAVGLAVIGSISWTVMNHHIRSSAHALGAAGPAAGHRAIVQPGGPLYDHALTAGVRTALTIGAGATVFALIVALIAIRVRKQGLPTAPWRLDCPSTRKTSP